MPTGSYPPTLILDSRGVALRSVYHDARPFPHSCRGSNRAGPYQAFDRCCLVFPDGTQAALAARRRVPLKGTRRDTVDVTPHFRNTCIIRGHSTERDCA